MEIKIFIKLTLFLVVSFFTFSCNSEKTKESEMEISQLVLEVTSNHQGLWQVSGESLDIRLFDNGIIEYDTKPPEITESLAKWEEIKITKQTKIGETDLKDFIEILTSEDFLKTDTYTYKCCCTDASIDVKIQSQLLDKRKIVTLKGFCDGNFINPNPQNAPNFPVLISQLMRKIRSVKSKLPRD